jgi:drug/metabolite transporter (DMT)-like permease
MAYLLLSILSSLFIYLTFKFVEHRKVNLGCVVAINYLVASVFGFMKGNHIPDATFFMSYSWWWVAMLIGFLFVVMFLLIGMATAKIGVALTAASTRLSMLIPMLVSIFIFEEPKSVLKFIEIAIALVAVYFTLYRKTDARLSGILYGLPFVLFIGSGCVDSLVKLAQHKFVAPEETGAFASSLFFFSFLCSLPLLLHKMNFRHLFRSITWGTGVVLGILNFGSLYFFMMALGKSNLESSVVFGVNNLVIVLFATLSGVFAYKEPMPLRNKIGLVMAMLAVVLLLN